MKYITLETTTLETKVLAKLRRYTKPVKTKWLATRLDVDRPTMAKVLNELTIQNQIRYHNGRYFNGKYSDDRICMGWVKVPSDGSKFPKYNKIEC